MSTKRSPAYYCSFRNCISLIAVYCLLQIENRQKYCGINAVSGIHQSVNLSNLFLRASAVFSLNMILNLNANKPNFKPFFLKGHTFMTFHGTLWSSCMQLSLFPVAFMSSCYWFFSKYSLAIMSWHDIIFVTYLGFLSHLVLNLDAFYWLVT